MTTGPTTGGQDGDRLDSWKAIAAFIGKDVRTALRWAKDGGMPVYHHAGRKRGAVYAYRSEIDAWIHADRNQTRPVRPVHPLMPQGLRLCRSMISAS